MDVYKDTRKIVQCFRWGKRQWTLIRQEQGICWRGLGFFFLGSLPTVLILHGADFLPLPLRAAEMLQPFLKKKKSRPDLAFADGSTTWSYRLPWAAYLTALCPSGFTPDGSGLFHQEELWALYRQRSPYKCPRGWLYHQALVLAGFISLCRQPFILVSPMRCITGFLFPRVLECASAGRIKHFYRWPLICRPGGLHLKSISPRRRYGCSQPFIIDSKKDP